MSDKPRPAGPPQGSEPAAGAPRSSARLINPRVRAYMDTLSLHRFYGGYPVTALSEQVLNLGIGEVGNMPLAEDVYTLYRRFLDDEALAGRATRYCGTMGERETNRLVAERLNDWLGERRFDENVVVSLDGAQNAVDVAVRTFTTPLGGKGSQRSYVLLAQPAYPYGSVIVSANAGAMGFLAYDGEQLTRGVETFCNPQVGLILLNVPNNPMGYVLTAEQAARINRVAVAHDCAIVVDAVYAAFPEDGGVGRALAGLDPARTVFVDSFSKKYGLPGLRVGFALCAEEELTYAMRFIKMSESLSPSNGKLAFAGYLLREHGGIPALIAAEVRERRRRFLERFDPAAVEGLLIIGEPHNPFYMALDIRGLCARTGLTDAEVTTHLQERYHVRVYPGTWAHPNPGLPTATFTGAGRHNPHGALPYLAPQYPAGARIVLAPEHRKGRIAALRLSFGAEQRIEGAAEALTAGLLALR